MLSFSFLGLPVIYDCIVVGAGPAGASAAYHLAGNGFSVLLLDREGLPRYKPCGGLVISRVAEWFDFDFTAAISLKVSRLRLSKKNADELSTEMQLPRPVWMVHRDLFDSFVVQRAKSRGATVIDQSAVTKIAPQSQDWRIFCGERSFNGRYLIAADGAKGPLSSWLGFNNRRRHLAGGLEAEIPDTRAPEPVLHLRFSDDFKGYAWNFPKAQSHSIGVGTFRDRVSLRAELEQYCDSFGLELKQGSLRGHPILCWDGEQPLHTDRALLAGEAACMVDPLTGEGIRPALITGMLAAEAIARALAGSRSALERYSETVQAKLGAEMRLAKFLASRLYSQQAASYYPGSMGRTLTALFRRLVCGDISYKSFCMAATFVKLIRRIAPVRQFTAVR